MNTFLVGGAVRDALLDIPVKDRDWVVVGATPGQLLEQGYQQVGADFPVFLHPDTHEEYALARTERKSGNGYQGFDCRFSPDVTLEEDLLRRDLTINAMASDAAGNIIDPYNGQQDLADKILRHVSPAFSEDPLRVLRIARFAARFAKQGFTIANETRLLMQQMVNDGELNHLVAERVWLETQRALGEDDPHVYFQVLRECNALKVWFQEIDDLFGIPQPEQHHPEIDCGVHALLSLQASVPLSTSTATRWAALTHDLGKALSDKENLPRHFGHETRGLKPIKSLCKKLKSPKEVQELALISSEFHTHIHRAMELKPETILKVFDRVDAWRKPERFEQLLLVSVADSRGRTGFEHCDYPQADYMREALQVALSVTAKDMIAQGITGAAIREGLQKARREKLTAWKQSII
jgi:tRNA nucleotidyltransferase (CCA-adding enzyme)